jgi:PAS domain S-box-containing protein
VDQRVLVFNMKRIAKNDLRMALDGRGKVVYSNSAMATMLGYTPSQIKAQDITTLLPRPFGQLHLKWMRVRPHSTCPR